MTDPNTAAAAAYYLSDPSVRHSALFPISTSVATPGSSTHALIGGNGGGGAGFVTSPMDSAPAAIERQGYEWVDTSDGSSGPRWTGDSTPSLGWTGTESDSKDGKGKTRKDRSGSGSGDGPTGARGRRGEGSNAIKSMFGGIVNSVNGA